MQPHTLHIRKCHDSQLAETLLDLLDHASLVLKLMDRILQLLIQNKPVGNHDYALEVRFTCMCVIG
jgi:hypothetical protein